MALLTKSRQVEMRLRHSIARGVYDRGALLPTEKELVERYGVSRTTIRDALNTLASDGLLERRQGAGTFVADSPVKNCVAVLAHLEHYTASVGYYTRKLVEELNRCIESAGYQPNFMVGQGKAIEEFSDSIHLLDRPITNKVLGVISLIDMGEFSARLDKAGIPNVAIVVGKSDSRHSVLLDYRQAVQLARQEFEAHGCTDYAVMYLESFQDQREESWFKEYLEVVYQAAPNPRHIIPIERTWDYGHAYAGFKEWWARADRPNAILFMDDALCGVASRAFLEFGIRVPEDLKVLTLNNKGHTFHLPYTLTSVGWDLQEVARLAWEKLDALIDDQPDSAPTIARPNIFPGSSLGRIVRWSI